METARVGCCVYGEMKRWLVWEFWYEGKGNGIRWRLNGKCQKRKGGVDRSIVEMGWRRVVWRYLAMLEAYLSIALCLMLWSLLW